MRFDVSFDTHPRRSLSCDFYLANEKTELVLLESYFGPDEVISQQNNWGSRKTKV